VRASLVVVAVIVVAAIGVGAFYLLNRPTGTLVMGVTDSPPATSNVTHVYLTITGIMLQGPAGNTTYNLSSTQFDLLKLTNVTKFLGTNKIPVGNYTMVRFNVSSAIATISGVNVTLTVPSGEVKVPIHFEVQSGKTTTVVLDITADMTNISVSHNFRPVVTVKTVSGPR
jgi:uncharacterized protein DUF4382